MSNDGALVHLALPNGGGGRYPDPAAGRISDHHLVTAEDRMQFEFSVLCLGYLLHRQELDTIGRRTLNRSFVTCPRCAMIADFVREMITWKDHDEKVSLHGATASRT